MYIDIISGVLTGEEGSFSKRISNQNEIKALYSGGEGTNQLTFELSVDVEMNLAASSLDDYISYRPRLVVENGSVVDDENNEIIYDLPGFESEYAFTSSTNILPLLQQWDTPIYTTAHQLDKTTATDLYRRMQVIRQCEEQLAKSHQRGLIHGA